MNEHEYPAEDKNKVPKGMIAFFLFVAVFLVAYILLYTPAISNWSYYKIYEESMKNAQATAPIEEVKESYSGDDWAIAEGAEIYASSCAVCHGADGAGGIGSSLISEFRYGDSSEEIYISIADGRDGGMPGFRQQLSDVKIRKLAAFLETLRD